MKNPQFLFGRKNITLFLAGLALILAGFTLMSGGSDPDPEVFNEGGLYGFQRITLAPILVLAGFVVEVFAIMKKPA